ncbi:DUF4224 domain-containing protein [Acidovorax sp. MR-S7]|uniref:DUF4224 domain-containing protein n=1 Tax=Acidovorax sp. MR-S7 TaxID=1268622 RepID=UPI0003D3B7F2|nr:DUF4224 domain-containing protein [Acidovorax sp. MR-S7]GAD20900.1 anaerobic dehydrogenases, typically selenocysteine-containing [Acidovorax sp. MR-S7]
MSTEGEFLDPKDIRKLAGASTTDQQEAFLKQAGIPHKRLGRRILLSRAHARAWLAGQVFAPSRGVNLGAVR